MALSNEGIYVLDRCRGFAAVKDRVVSYGQFQGDACALMTRKSLKGFVVFWRQCCFLETVLFLWRIPPSLLTHWSVKTISILTICSIGNCFWISCHHARKSLNSLKIFTGWSICTHTCLSPCAACIPAYSPALHMPRRGGCVGQWGVGRYLYTAKTTEGLFHTC
jgi:hypothetical protein